MTTESAPATLVSNAPINVEVEVSPHELERAGYHHKDICNVTDLTDAVQLLHEQAHNAASDPLDAMRCTNEPCRTLFSTAGQS